MKKVLIIDNHPLFRDYLRQKLSEDQIEVILTQEKRDSFTKMISNLPNLIIFDMGIGNADEIEFLEQKAADSNTAGIPTIITGPIQDRSYIASLAKYGVIKYFEKPIQFDMLFESIGKVLHTPLSMDETPCVLDLHRNKDIIFIELALGLNREKLALLHYKLSEMITREQIDVPKIIVMLTNLDLTFVDGYNLEFLLDNIIDCPKVHNKNIKVLSLSSYVKEFLSGHVNYNEIEMSTNLPKVLNSLVSNMSVSSVSDLITDKILTPTDAMELDDGTVDTRFSSDTSPDHSKSKNDGTVLRIGVIDDNMNSLAEIKSIFSDIGAECTGFSSGKEFLNSYQKENFNLVILDVLIGDKTGLEVLQNLQADPKAPPVIVYSQSTQRDLIVKALSSGAKTYLVKPQKPNILIQKSLGVLGN